MAMEVANFTGGEAEELRRAFGFKRSEQRMRAIEQKLRDGMEKNGIVGEQQDKITKAITSFAMFGFPESHAASFALLAYASAYLRTHYLPVFTCALLNNQPMGFYSAATVVKDAQRHGLKVLPVDINRSRVLCTIEDFQLRLGLNYVRGLRTAKAIVLQQPFQSIEDLALRVPEITADDMEKLASIGALNSIGAKHRRDGLWRASWATRPAGTLISEVPEPDDSIPLQQMTIEERLIADHVITGMTTGRHPMAHRRAEMIKLRVVCAGDLAAVPHGRNVRVAGNIIVRQRPGTAKGITFVSLEDETGISNVVVKKEIFEAQRTELLLHPWIMAEGKIQNVDGVIHVLAKRIVPLSNPLQLKSNSHDFH
jgi:error-prone DNA polymerase